MRLTLKILVPLFIVLSVVFVVINLISVKLFKDIFLENKALSLGDHALREVREVFSEDDFKKQEVDDELRGKMKAYTKTIQDTSVFRIKIWDRNSVIVYSDLGTLVGEKVNFDNDSLNKLLSGNVPVEWGLIDDRVSIMEEGYGSYLLIHVPMKDSSGETKYILELSSATSAILQGIQTSINKTIYIFLGAAVVIYLAFYLALRFLVILPILRLRKAISMVTNGDFSVEVSEKARDEIGDLAKNFNEMRKRLNETFASLDKSKKELEENNDQLIKQGTDLAKRTEEFERMNKLMVGRELKMVELKKEINMLKQQKLTKVGKVNKTN